MNVLARYDSHCNLDALAGLEAGIVVGGDTHQQDERVIGRVCFDAHRHELAFRHADASPISAFTGAP